MKYFFLVTILSNGRHERNRLYAKSRMTRSNSIELTARHHFTLPYRVQYMCSYVPNSSMYLENKKTIMARYSDIWANQTSKPYQTYNLNRGILLGQPSSVLQNYLLTYTFCLRAYTSATLPSKLLFNADTCEGLFVCLSLG